MNKIDIKEFRSKIRIFEREIGRVAVNDTTCCGVTLTQCHILMELDNNNEVSIKDLANVLELDKSTLSRTIDGMVNIGLVNRDINSKDRRYMKITLTEQGKKTINIINDLCNSYYNELFKLIPEGKHNVIVESMSIIADSMGKIRKNKSNDNCCDTKYK